jgi:predicted nucleotidyltransferase
MTKIVASWHRSNIALEKKTTIHLPVDLRYSNQIISYTRISLVIIAGLEDGQVASGS